MSKHVLVTGGAGFIGSQLVDAYLERGWRVTVIDDLSTGDRRNLNPRAEFHQLDVRQAGDIVRRVKPDVINHHAAQMDVRRSVADPLFDAAVNVIGSLVMLQAAADTAVKRFIFASSGGALYGEPLSVPQNEEHPANPLSPYGCAKLAVEHYIHYYRVVHGLSAVSVTAGAWNTSACAMRMSMDRARTRRGRREWWPSSSTGCCAASRS